MAACLARAVLTHPTGIALPQTCKYWMVRTTAIIAPFGPRSELTPLGSSFVFQRQHTPDIQGAYSTRHDDPRTWAPPINPKRVPRLLLYWSLLKWFRALIPASWVKAGVPPSQRSGDVAVLEPHSMGFSPGVGTNLEFGTLSSPVPFAR